jgi:hypothetical protein
MKLKPAALFGVMPEGHPASSSTTLEGRRPVKATDFLA